MKKSAVFLILSLVLPGFFACQFSIPTAVEIIGNPSAKFAEEIDVGKKFEDLIRHGIDKDERLTMIPCTNDEIEIITNIIYLELINEEYDDLEDKTHIHLIFPSAAPDLSEFIGVKKLDEDKILIARDPNNRLVIPLSELGSILPGFVFYDGKDADENVVTDQDGVYKTKLYFSGSDILVKSKVRVILEEVYIEGNEEKYKPIELPKDEFDIEDQSSGIENGTEEYAGKSCPSGGIDIGIPLTGKDIAISFEVFIPEGTDLYLSDFGASNIIVELLLWLPLKFKAVKEDASLFFPEDYFFNPTKDIFGRKEKDSESLAFDIIESLSVDVNFKKHPFKDAELIIWNYKEFDEEGNLINSSVDEKWESIHSNKGVIIRSPIGKDDALSFTVAEDKMKEINNPDNWPFAPDIIIGFNKNDTLSFKKDFNASEFAFKAKVHYRKDF